MRCFQAADEHFTNWKKGERRISKSLPGHISSSHPTGREGGENPASLQAAANLPAPQATAVISWLWKEALLVCMVGVPPKGLPAVVRHGAVGDECDDNNNKKKKKRKKNKARSLKRSTGTLPFPQKKKSFVNGGNMAKIKHSTRGNLPLGSWVN